jgi:BirA family biotin operon repressor/biotin-[acetyl-CoA-carboxylase] ligase
LLFFKSLKIISIETLESTNELAWLKLKNREAEHGDVILANYQTKGKGQSGNHWYSSPNANILASIICKDVNCRMGDLPKINMLVSLALYHFIRPYFINKVSIKWPNDILVDQQKIGGILIETSVQGECIKNAVIGIGINVNEGKFPSHLTQACSFYTINHKHYAVLELIPELLGKLDEYLSKLKYISLNELIKDYNEALFGMEVKRYFRKGIIDFEGKIIGINSLGQLQINTKNGVEIFNNKDIEFIF